ncbi:MAG: D-alanyl-D-alanine carboxypeptidase [Oscillospiraceae bacterium]|nr:D-alanyl-D-alanine carboxypeptidase [Oscillospiraceae bacterium]
MPKWTVLLFLPAFLCTHAAAFAQSAPQVSAASCILMYEDGQTLYEKNVDTRSLIASTTKLMTALVCLERASLDENVTVRPDCCEVEGSSMCLRAGERYTVRELLLGLLLASGNDAALALAEHVSGGVQGFAALMNQKAEALGLSSTHFANPHGLDAPGHYSTARDLARLMLACMDNDVFRALDSTPRAELGGTVFLNHNKLLLSCPGCIGGKTGYTAAAGRCLVSCCERGGMRLVCVTLDDPDDWRDHEALYDWACAVYRLYDPKEELKLEVPLINGGRRTVSVVPERGRALLLPADETVTLEIELPRFVFAPVKKGETAGELRVVIGQRIAAEYPLVYAENAEMAVAF